MPTLTSATLGKFCRELMCGLSPVDILIKEWGLTPSDYERICASEGFRAEMLVVAAEMKELGADAGYVYRMKSLAEEHVSEIVKIMNNDLTTTSQKIDLIRFCAEMGRLKEKPVPNSAAQGGPRGPHVVFHFGAGLPIKSVEVLPDADPQQVQSPGEAVEEVVGNRAIGFQFDPV